MIGATVDHAIMTRSLHRALDIGLTMLERQAPDEVWRATTRTAADVLRMPEIGIDIPVPELNEDVQFAGETPVT